MSEAIDVTTTEKDDPAVEVQAKNENEETPTVEELMAQLAEAKATGAKQKQALDKRNCYVCKFTICKFSGNR